jgi:hypothetical protein
MNKSKLTITTLSDSPLTVSIKKNGRAVSDAVARNYLQRHYPDSIFVFVKSSHALIATEKT